MSLRPTSICFSRRPPSSTGQMPPSSPALPLTSGLLHLLTPRSRGQCPRQSDLAVRAPVLLYFPSRKESLMSSLRCFPSKIAFLHFFHKRLDCKIHEGEEGCVRDSISHDQPSTRHTAGPEKISASRFPTCSSSLRAARLGRQSYARICLDMPAVGAS